MLRHAHGFILLESFDCIAVRAEQLILTRLVLQNPIVVGHATAATATHFLLASTENVVDVQSTRVRIAAMSALISELFLDLTAKFPLL